MTKQRTTGAFDPLSRRALSERPQTDLRVRVLLAVLKKEGLDSASELPQPQPKLWRAILNPPPRQGSIAIMTIRSQEVDGISPERQAKRAALLYDQLVVESGVLIAQRPPFKRVDLRESVLHPLQALGADWITPLELPAPLSSAAIEARALEARGIGRPILRAADLEGMPLSVDLNLKLGTVAAHLEVARWIDATLVAPDRWLKQFSELVSLRGTAIDLLLPNFDRLTWGQIAEFRAHPGSKEARDRLRLWEAAACGDPSQTSSAHAVSVAQAITKDLMAAVHDLRPRFGTSLAKEGVLTSASLVPGVGPAVAKVVAIGESARAAWRDRRTWHAALSDLLASDDD